MISLKCKKKDAIKTYLIKKKMLGMCRLNMKKVKVISLYHIGDYKTAYY